MKVRHSFLISVLLGLGLAGAAVNTMSTGTMLSSFMDIERQRAQQDLKRIDSSLNQQLQALHAQNLDWANWDDTFVFAKDGNKAFIQSNLAAEGLSGASRLTAVLVLRNDLSLVCFAKSVEEESKDFQADSVLRSLRQADLLDQKASSEEGALGFIEAPSGPVMASVLPILRSDQTGPSPGRIIMLRAFGPRVQSELAQMSGLDLSFSEVKESAVGRAPLSQAVWFEKDAAKAKTYIKDPHGRPLMAVTATLPLTAMAAGKEITRWMMIQLVGAGAILLVIISLVTIAVVIKPLESMGSQILAVNEESEGQIIEVSGPTEIRLLAARLNHLLERLCERGQRLMENEEELRSQNDNLEKIVSERTQQIEFQAYHDKLTGLPNRALFLDRLGQAVRRLERGGRTLAVLFIDLDNFKLVNDSLGHDVGDQLLVQVAERLLMAVRPGDTVARLGGDEFTILLEDIDCEEEAAEVARRIQTSLRAPHRLAGKEAFAGGSIGIALKSHLHDSPESLMKAADTAMYHAKAMGRSRYVFFSPEMAEQAVERLDMETALRKAVAEGHITPHFQPLVELSTGKVIGCEALARWTHPEKGPIPPDVFIPIAEETGLIVPLGWQMLKTSCEEAVVIRKILENSDFVMSVNLSARQFQSKSLVPKVKSILDETGLPPECLKLEITESILMENREESVKKMQELKALGLWIALDDFGTGYSSLSTLHSFPIDTLKIDKSFIGRLEREEGALAIVEAILAMARTLKINVTGEGVESRVQADLIKSLGCQVGQGYLFDRPLGREEMEKRMLEIHKRDQLDQAA